MKTKKTKKTAPKSYYLSWEAINKKKNVGLIFEVAADSEDLAWLKIQNVLESVKYEINGKKVEILIKLK